MIEFRGIISERDYINYIKTHMMNSKITHTWMFATMLIWPIMETVKLISTGVQFDKILVVTFLVLFGISFIFVCIMYYILYRIRVMQAIKVLRKGNSFDEKEFMIDGEQISIKSKMNSSTTSWNGIKKIRDKYDTYYLYVNPTEAIIVPKRYLDDSDIKCFKELAGDIKILG